jgi:hypothetical protein
VNDWPLGNVIVPDAIDSSIYYIRQQAYRQPGTGMYQYGEHDLLTYNDAPVQPSGCRLVERVLLPGIPDQRPLLTGVSRRYYRTSLRPPPFIETVLKILGETRSDLLWRPTAPVTVDGWVGTFTHPDIEILITIMYPQHEEV